MRNKVVLKENIEHKRREKRIRDTSPAAKQNMSALSLKANDIMAALQKKWYGYEGIKEEEDEDQIPDADFTLS